MRTSTKSLIWTPPGTLSSMPANLESTPSTEQVLQHRLEYLRVACRGLSNAFRLLGDHSEPCLLVAQCQRSELLETQVKCPKLPPVPSSQHSAMSDHGWSGLDGFAWCRCISIQGDTTSSTHDPHSLHAVPPVCNDIHKFVTYFTCICDLVVEVPLMQAVPACSVTEYLSHPTQFSR